MFNDSSLADCVTLENDFFLKAPEILKVEKSWIENCKATNDHSFQVQSSDQIRHMVEACFLNPRVQYNGLIEPVTNRRVLELLNTRNF